MYKIELIHLVVSAPASYSSDTKLLYQVRGNAAKKIEEIMDQK